MDRKGQRGCKPKNLPPKDLFALGGKVSSSSSSGRNQGSSSGSNDSQGTQLVHEKSSHSSNYAKSSGVSSDRGREGSSMLNKKAKSGFASSRALATRPTPGPKIATVDLQEGWESIAEAFQVDDFLSIVAAEERDNNYEKIESYLCGSVKMLKAQRMKPDNFFCLNLLYLAKIKPHFFNDSLLIIEAYCSLLKRGEHNLSFKAKINSSIAVLAANVLYQAFLDKDCWPEIFVKVFIEDSLGERMWVDHEDCKPFVDNIIASFNTNIPPKSLYFPDLTVSNRPSECPSPASIGSGVESVDADSERSLECRETSDVPNRYLHIPDVIEAMVIEAVQNQLNLRHQNVDAVARNFIRFLSAVCGLMEIRKIIVGRLDAWITNHKHQRLALELLMSMCLNCNTHSADDQRVISQIVHIRIKVKLVPVVNQYTACLRELLAAHPLNIASILKETVFNELSPNRNPSNMTNLAVVFQFAPQQAAMIMADIFIELLMNKEDFLRALRALLKEIVRSLRHDIPYRMFCAGLMKDQKETFEFKERMFLGIIDLIISTLYVSVSPQVRDAANLVYRGEMRDLEVLKKYQENASLIQQDALYWMYKIVPKCYTPSKEEYIKQLHKLLMLDPPDSYFAKDNFPLENERTFYFRIVVEIPFKQESIEAMLDITELKEQYFKPQEILDLLEKILRRITAISYERPDMLRVTKIEIIDSIFQLCRYIPPDISLIPTGYTSPITAIASVYWKAWCLLLLISAHNPTNYDALGWRIYPTLRVMMEMCITNCIRFPPPTMSIGEKGEEMNNQELLISARERHQILEFESHLAQKMITEQNSLLLSQLITKDEEGVARKPPLVVLEQLEALNKSHKIGHLLCRCREPDFLVEIIQRQGAPQSMPWLAQLVESSEDAFSVLPVQCLCEFLLSETVVTTEGNISTRHQPLLDHLRCLLRSPRQGKDFSVQILEYFLRRLSAQLPSSRMQAVRGLQLVVGPLSNSMEIEPDKQEPHKWLLEDLVALPGFENVKGAACQFLRQACMIETKESTVSAYIRFLAVQTCEDSLQDMAALVQDMAHLIVERSTMTSNIMVGNNAARFPHAKDTLDSLFTIFLNYMLGARAARHLPSREDEDHVRVQWATGEEATMHILVIHAMVILLISGPFASRDLFNQLLNSWFPKNQDMPQAFLVGTAQEALLLPDWLKLKMIRSTVDELVDAALKDLEPSQLVLFIQSFGIPVVSMTKLLHALDGAVETNKEAVEAAVLDKSHKNYMATLVEVQHQRGAKGGHCFALTLSEDGSIPNVEASVEAATETNWPFSSSLSPCIAQPLAAVTPMEVSKSRSALKVDIGYILNTFSDKWKIKPTEKRSLLRTLQLKICSEIAGKNIKKIHHLVEFEKKFREFVTTDASFVNGLHKYHIQSKPIFTLLLQMKGKVEFSPLFSSYSQLISQILTYYSPPPRSLLTPIWKEFIEHIPRVIGARDCGVPLIKKEASQDASDVPLLSIRDLQNEDSALSILTKASPPHIERLIRDLTELAIKTGKIKLVVNAIVQLLINKMRGQKTTNVPGQHIAILLDWLQVLDPELQFVPPHMSKLLLFGNAQNTCSKTLANISSSISATLPSTSVVVKSEIDESWTEGNLSTIAKVGYGQAYLLSAFTHQANWAPLEAVIHELLQTVAQNLNPVTILDFVWAVLHVPKLWQGRERRTPRHVVTDLPLKLNTLEIKTLSQYMLLEIQNNRNDSNTASPKLQERVSLLFLCLQKSPLAMPDLIQHLALQVHTVGNEQSQKAVTELLYYVYLQHPKIVQYLSSATMGKLLDIQINMDTQERSAADVSLHTLITMLTSPLPEKDFIRRMQDLEAAVRKMASSHPLLVIRKLPLLASTLQGLTHFNYSTFQMKNYPELFSMVLGILELLRPLIFYEKYSKPFMKSLKAFIELFEEHGRNRELGSILMRTCQLLMAWVGTRSSSAPMFVSKYSDLFSRLMRSHPEMLPLRSLAAIAISKGNDHPKGDFKTSSEDNISMTFRDTISGYVEDYPLPFMMQQQVRDLQSQLENFKTVEEQSDLLRRARDLSDHSMGHTLPPFFHCFGQGLLSSDLDNREKSWNLLIQLLRKKPKMAAQINEAVLSSLNCDEIAVGSTAVEHLPEVILMLHEYSPDLLSAAFNVCLYAEPSITEMLSEALFLLTINTGA